MVKILKGSVYFLQYMFTSNQRLRQVHHAFFILSLQDLANEREDEEREDCAPYERVDDHDYPPENAAGGCAEGIGDDVAWLTKESLEEQEQNEMHHAQRYIGEQE